MNLYDILGVGVTATNYEIKQAYRKLVSTCHPDKHPDNPEAIARFKQIQEAFEVLSDDAKRKHYDQFGEAGAEESESRAKALCLISNVLSDILIEVLRKTEQPLTVNILGALKDKIRAKKNELKKYIKDAKKNAAYLKAIAARFSIHNNKDNILAGIASNPIKDIDEKIIEWEEDLQTTNLALAELGTYGYQYDKPEPVHWFHARPGWGQATNGMPFMTNWPNVPPLVVDDECEEDPTQDCKPPQIENTNPIK